MEFFGDEDWLQAEQSELDRKYQEEQSENE